MKETQGLTALGWVERVDEQNFAYIRTQRETGCGGCGASETCGTSVLARLFSNRSQDLMKIPNELATRPGDQVELKLQGSDLLRQAFMVYGLPLLGLFVGALLAQQIWPQSAEWVKLLASLFGMVFAWFSIRYFYRPVAPKMVRVIRV